MFCSKCGKENDESAKFCSSCGNSLGSDVEKSAEQKAEEIKQKSKESATTIFYLIKPLLKLKVLVPMVVIFLGVMFYPSMKSAYENYQYEKEKIAKEKRGIQKKLKYQEKIFNQINDDVLGIKIGDNAGDTIANFSLGYQKATDFDRYDGEYGYGSITRRYTLWGEEYPANSISLEFQNCIVARIIITQRLSGSKEDIKKLMIDKYGEPVDVFYDTDGDIQLVYEDDIYDKHIAIQNFNSRRPRNGVYIYLGFKDSYMQTLFRTKNKYTCKQLNRF